jgi:hypothetical protein
MVFLLQKPDTQYRQEPDIVQEKLYINQLDVEDDLVQTRQTSLKCRRTETLLTLLADREPWPR